MRALPTISISFLLSLIDSSNGFCFGSVPAGYKGGAIQFIQSVAEGPPATTFHMPFFGPSFLGGLQVFAGSFAVAAVILIALFLWIFASIASTIAPAALKRRATISVWIGFPAAPYCILWLTNPNGIVGMLFTATISMTLWTDVFAAIAVGGVLRRRFLTRWQPPDPLSLPLAAFAFTVIATVVLYLFVIYGTIDGPMDCARTPHSPLSLCGWIDYQGFYVVGIVLAIIVFCGIALPADSNLIRANDRLGSFVRSVFRRAHAALEANRQLRRERRKQEEEERAAREEAYEAMTQEEEDSYPVPALSEDPFVDAMRLKLRRSQRSSFMGKMLFALDARIELTAEELSLVAKYDLGDTVIYESSSRERHREAMRAHAESTRDQPGLSAGPGAQLLGAGKTLFRIALTGASATALALSLRVTVYSLMQGVHIECKSMGELLDAENAIVEAAQNLKAYLQTAVTFDGREAIIDL
jgi:hypothetical protein